MKKIWFILLYTLTLQADQFSLLFYNRKDFPDACIGWSPRLLKEKKAAVFKT